MRTTVNCDLAVLGAGPGGVAAAICAARAGAKVLLVERNGYLGGNAVSGLPFLGFLERSGRKVIGGFGDELVETLHRRGEGGGHRFCPMHNSVAIVRPEPLKLLLADLCAQAGVRVLLHAELIEAQTRDGAITRATVAGKAGLIDIEAQIYIDGTGDGDLAYLAGADYEKSDSPQPPSVLFTLANVDIPRFIQYVTEEHPEDRGDAYSAEYLRQYLVDRTPFYFVGLNGLYERLSPKGLWPVSIWALVAVFGANENEVVVNGPRVLNADCTDVWDITRGELEGQKQTEAYLAMLKEYIPGFERAYISKINPSLGVREARRVLGVHYLLKEEISDGQIPDDAVALGIYPIDIHSGTDDSSYWKKLDKPYGIPYGCLVSRSLKNLMMAGRCISVDPNAYGSTRVIAPCFAVGEAAGVAAAMAVRAGVSPAQVDVRALREALRAQGARVCAEDLK